MSSNIVKAIFYGGIALPVTWEVIARATGSKCRPITGCPVIGTKCPLPRVVKCLGVITYCTAVGLAGYKLFFSK